jgi:hypothetical protein
MPRNMYVEEGLSLDITLDVAGNANTLHSEIEINMHNIRKRVKFINREDSYREI